MATAVYVTITAYTEGNNCSVEPSGTAIWLRLAALPW